MKTIIFTIAIGLLTSIVFSTEIVATVVFENRTNKELTSGRFTILNMNKTTEITNTDSFHITLPKKGKYRFVFVSDDFTA